LTPQSGIEAIDANIRSVLHPGGGYRNHDDPILKMPRSTVQLRPVEAA